MDHNRRESQKKLLKKIKQLGPKYDHTLLNTVRRNLFINSLNDVSIVKPLRKAELTRSLENETNKENEMAEEIRKTEDIRKAEEVRKVKEIRKAEDLRKFGEFLTTDEVFMDVEGVEPMDYSVEE